MGDEKGQGRAARQESPHGFPESVPGRIVGRVLCIGGAALDTMFVARQPVVAGTSNPAAGSRAFGGVARNIAENLARLGVPVGLLSVIGDDRTGAELKRRLDDLGVDTSRLTTVPGARTAEYIALLEPDRNLALGIADMEIFDRLDGERLEACSLDTDWIIVDCNCTAAALKALLGRRIPFAGRLAVDAVSVAKAERLPEDLGGIDLLFLNLDEAASILRMPKAGLLPHRALSGLRSKGARAVVLTLGADGVLAEAQTGGPVHVPAVPAEVADVTGAGDALVAATVAATLAGSPLPEAACWGCLAATLTLEHRGSTCPDLSFAGLHERARQSLSPCPT